MLKTRVITALFLVAGLAAVLFQLPPRFAPFAFAGVAALAAWEWGGFMRQDRAARVMYAFVILLFCWQLQVGMPELMVWFLALSAAFWLLAVPFWLQRKWTLAGNDIFGYAIGAVVILPTWIAMVALHARSPWGLLAAMALVWVADIAAYFAGRRFGKHKLAPAISPGKTWEGVAGAVAGVAIYGAALWLFSPLPTALPVVALAVLPVLTLLSIVGDLFESLMKRQAGIKDSSQLLPGHGGVLDRIDSLTSTLPLVALLLHFAQ